MIPRIQFPKYCPENYSIYLEIISPFRYYQKQKQIEIVKVFENNNFYGHIQKDINVGGQSHLLNLRVETIPTMYGQDAVCVFLTLINQC